MARKLLFPVCIILSAVFFAGCQPCADTKKVDLSRVEEIKGAPQSSLGIRIGLVPEQDIRKMAAIYEPFAEYLGKKLNSKVTLVYLDSYSEVCDKFIYKQLDAAFFGSFSYALTRAKAQVEPIMRPDYHGASTYRGLIIVRQGSGIKNAADMKGKRLALVHQATYAGYLYPLFYFNGHGINNLEGYFSKVIFTGGHDKVIFALLRGEADVAASKDLVYQTIIRDNPDLEKKLAVLSVSNPVPSNTLCVRKDLGPALKSGLKNILLNLDKDPAAGFVLEALGASRFIETKDGDYNYLYEIIRALGIDLNTYPYYDRPDIGFDRGVYVQEQR